MATNDSSARLQEEDWLTTVVEDQETAWEWLQTIFKSSTLNDFCLEINDNLYKNKEKHNIAINKIGGKQNLK